MKLLALTLTFLFAASSLDAKFILWPSGKELVYDYYGHYLSSVEGIGNRVVGVGLKAQVSVAVQSERDIVLKLNNVQTASLNDDVEDVDEDTLPWKFQKPSGKVASHVEQPVRVSMENGRVKSIELSSEEVHESVNIKKAILTMLQLDTSKILDPTSSRPRSQSSLTYSKSYRFRPNDLTSLDDEVNVIRVFEDGIGGDCESVYIISSDPSLFAPDADVMNITKLRNFNDCKERPQWVRSSQVAVECEDCVADEKHPFQTVNSIEYDIKRRDNVLTIESIESEGQTLFKPYTSNSDYLMANHSQIMTLSKVRQLTTSFKPVATVRLNTLRYQFPTAHRALHSGPYNIKKRQVPFLNDEKVSTVSEASQIFEKLLQQIQSEAQQSQRDPTATLEMYNVVKALRLMSFEEIGQFFANAVKHVSRDPERLADDRTQLAVQLISMSGSAPSVLYIKYLIESQMITGELAVQVVQNLPTNMYEVPYELLNEILSMAKNRVVREHSQLFKTTWLTFGILVSQACDGPEDDLPSLEEPPHIRSFCPQEIERKFLQEIQQQLKAADDADKFDEVLLFMKVLGLTQLPDAVEILKPFASGETDDHESIQIAALKNLRDIATFAPDETEDVAEDEFYDTDNSAPVRIAALRVLLASQPDFDDLQQIVTWADKEPSDDVSGFILSFFQAMSNSSHYCTKDLSNNAEQLLAFLDDEDENGIQGSNFWESSQIFDDLGVSTKTVVSWVKSNNSIIPESFSLCNNITVAGYSVKPLQIQVHTKGLQTIVDRIIGPKGAFRRGTQLEEEMRPESEDTQKDRTPINRKLNIQPREDDEFFLNIFAKFGGTQARMAFIDADSIVEYFKSGAGSRLSLSHLRQGIPIHFHKLALMYELQYQMPSLLGLPIVLHVFNPTIASVRGKVATSFENVQGSIVPLQVKVDVDLKASVQSRLVMRLGVYNPFNKQVSVTGVSQNLYLNAPVHAQADVNLLNGEVKVQLKPSPPIMNPTSQHIELASYKVKPYSCQYKLDTMMDICQHPKTIHQDDEPDEDEIDLSQHYLGIPVVLKSVSEHDWTDLGSFLSELEDYDDVISYATTLFTLPEFSPRHYQVLLDNNQAKEKAIDMTLHWEYNPTPVERKVMESKQTSKGLWAPLVGYAKLPQRCGTRGQGLEGAEDEFWYIEKQEKQSRSSLQQEEDDDEDDEDDENDDENSYDYDDYLTSRGKGDLQSYRSRSPFIHDRSRMSYQTFQSPSSKYSSSYERIGASGPVSRDILEFQRGDEVASLKVEMKVTAKGTQAQFGSKLKVKRDLNTLIDTASLEFELINIPIVASNNLHICTSGSVKYPEVPCDFHSAMNPSFVQPIIADFKASWGQQCSDNAQIAIKAKFEKSPEQLEKEAEKDDWYYEQCQEDLRNGKKLSDACDLVQETISSLNKVDIQVEFTELPKWLLNISHKVDTFLKVHNYPYMSNNPVDVHNPPGKLRVKAYIYEDVSAYSMKIMKPTENTIFHKVPLDDDLPYTYSISTTTPIYEQLLDELTDGYANPSCEVMGKFIQTFDNNTYKIPLSGCQHVLAKDCSKDDLFAVTMSKLSDVSKKLKVNVLSHEITVVPGDRYKGVFHVEIDETVVHPTDEKVIAIKTNDRDANGMIVALILTTGPVIHIQLPFTGVIVKFDGEDAEVEVSNMWRGQVCGLCGEFREESFEDLVGPQECIYPDPVSFGLSYGLEEGCQLPRKPNSQKQCDNDFTPFPHLEQRDNYRSQMRSYSHQQPSRSNF